LLNSISSLAKPSQVAIIIDDIGYRKSDVQALYLPGNISYAILPHTPYGLSLALQAKAKSNDVILHIPMEAQNGKKLGPGALTSKMDETSIRQQLSQAFAEVPFALGINNHMGSKLTELYNPMAWTMQFLKERELIFIDSMTSSASQAEKVAKSFGVPSLHRHIFLDNQLEHSYISGQFNKLILATKKNQTVVAIAHPHPETIRSLRKLLPLLAENNIELVPISALVGNNNKPSTPQVSADE
jgi:polysaccharide deacetylase 2 family uncharacterized protein YibQ